LDNRLEQDFRRGVVDAFTTLEVALATIDPSVGFNVEVKYPTTEEIRLFGLMQLERNEFVDRILQVVFEQVQRRHRLLYFSSFDVECCILLRRKQNIFPVFFLTEGGSHSPMMHLHDVRMTSLEMSVQVALENDLFGIVTANTPILEGGSKAMIKLLQSSGLVVLTYGKSNNEVSVVQEQLDANIGAVISDHVNYLQKNLRAKISSELLREQPLV
jgi:glycerophosphodiester phosphodiesterase